jgi:hypothetical protein
MDTKYFDIAYEEFISLADWCGRTRPRKIELQPVDLSTILRRAQELKDADQSKDRRSSI